MKYLLLGLLMSSAYAHVVPGVTDVRIIQRNGKNVELLTSATGFSLYTFDPDGADESNCYDGCARAWPPVLLTPAQVATLEDNFHAVKRKDGTLQLSFASHPLYLFVGDKKPADTNGDGLKGVWHLAVDEE